ncbi:MAG TPA: HAMP domain-containing sensor histidine kinase [Candidatus Baltobacteraceae bacterium]|nr:HAMP domain-containing sensor histidine kinase [Candidatus Baltobacteraceae bacterium]
MHSLRLRIAVWYTLLLVVAIGAVGIAITMRFESILHAQAEQHLSLTLQDMERAVAPEPGSFLFNGPGTLLALENPDNLERWTSVNTFIEVDDLRGYTLAKSFNMGSLASFGNAGLTPRVPRTSREVVVDGRRFLVESDLLVSGNIGLVVQVGEPLDALDQAFRQTEISIAAILLITAVALAVLSFVLANEITSPLNQLAEAMRQIGSEGLHRRIRWRGRQDEAGALAQAFDDLLARLEEAFARERRFISDASHELKTPLTSINANAQMLARWGDRDAAIRSESLETIIAESSSLAGMVNGMLTLAKADSGDDVPKEPVSLGAVAREAVHTRQPRAAEKNLTLTLDVPAEAPIVYGDAALLRQLVTNLVDNAIKFTSEGGVTVSVSQDGDDAIVEIADTGPGIDPDELPLIFDRFYRADKSRTRAVPGTGLGLAIVRSIARVHDGTVTARAGQAGGTVFRVTLPCIH